LPATEIENKCFHCGGANKILVETEYLEKWYNGALIQEAFPNLTSNERELIQTGIHPECWDKMFG
jgi:hypothetical protein